MSKRELLETVSPSKRQKMEISNEIVQVLPEPPKELNDEPEALKSDEEDKSKKLRRLTPAQKKRNIMLVDSIILLMRNWENQKVTKTG